MPINNDNHVSKPISLKILVGFFVAFMLIFSGALLFSLFNRAELVSPDYYARGVDHQRRIDAASRAKNLPELPQIDYEDSSQTLCVFFPLTLLNQVEGGQLNFIRQADSKQDFSLPIALDKNGVQRADLSQKPAGPWTIELAWRMTSQDYFIQTRIIKK